MWSPGKRRPGGRGAPGGRTPAAQAHTSLPKHALVAEAGSWVVSVWISVAVDLSGRRLRAVTNNAGVAVNAPVEALAFPAPRGFGRGESRPFPSRTGPERRPAELFGKKPVGITHPVAQQWPALARVDDVLDSEVLGGAEGGRDRRHLRGKAGEVSLGIVSGIEPGPPVPAKPGAIRPSRGLSSGSGLRCGAWATGRRRAAGRAGPRPGVPVPRCLERSP